MHEPGTDLEVYISCRMSIIQFSTILLATIVRFIAQLFNNIKMVMDIMGLNWLKIAVVLFILYKVPYLQDPLT